MTTKLLEDIEKYIGYLGSNGLWITVHGEGIDGLLEHNIHRNPYCALVKTDSAAWQRCKQHQQKVFRACGQECLFGMCYAGVEEYVFFVNEKTFVSVSGYGSVSWQFPFLLCLCLRLYFLYCIRPKQSLHRHIRQLLPRDPQQDTPCYNR